MTNRQPGLLSGQLPPRHPIVQGARDLEVVRQSVDELDAYVNNALANLAGAANARGQYTSGQSLTVNTWTPVTWGATLDPYGMMSVSTPSRFTIPVTGLYAITANVVFEATASTFGAYLSLYRNGSPAQGGVPQYGNPAASNAVTLTVSDLLPCTAGDYLEAYAEVTGVATSINGAGFVGYMTVLLAGATS